MKALSVRQPHATLLVLGFKKFETRTWVVDHRDDLLIHASKGREDWQLETWADPLVKRTLKGVGYDSFNDLPFGCIVGRTRLVRIHKTDRMSPARYEGFEEKVGNFRRGRYAWEMADPTEIDSPVPASGMPGLWDYSLNDSERDLLNL